MGLFLGGIPERLKGKSHGVSRMPGSQTDGKDCLEGNCGIFSTVMNRNGKSPHHDDHRAMLSLADVLILSHSFAHFPFYVNHKGRHCQTNGGGCWTPGTMMDIFCPMMDVFSRMMAIFPFMSDKFFSMLDNYFSMMATFLKMSDSPVRCWTFFFRC